MTMLQLMITAVIRIPAASDHNVNVLGLLGFGFLVFKSPAQVCATNTKNKHPFGSWCFGW